MSLKQIREAIEKFGTEISRLILTKWVWIGILTIVLTGIVVNRITDPFHRDVELFRDSLVDCLGAPEALCEPLQGNPVGTSEAGQPDSVGIYDDEYVAYGDVLLMFNDMHYRVVITNDVVERFAFDGDEYFYNSGAVYRKRFGKPDSSGVLYAPK